MQTFITSDEGDWVYTAQTLDNLRLNKQALEGWQILMSLLEIDPKGEYRQARGWKNHPAVKMWSGYELSLYGYIQVMVKEWHSRGYNSTIGDKATETIQVAYENNLLADYEEPWWRNPTTMKKLASTHRQALLWKNYPHYSQFGWAEDTGEQPDTYEYFWVADLDTERTNQIA